MTTNSPYSKECLFFSQFILYIPLLPSGFHHPFYFGGTQSLSLRKGKTLNMHKKVGGPLTKHDFENGLNQVFMGCSPLALTIALVK